MLLGPNLVLVVELPEVHEFVRGDTLLRVPAWRIYLGSTVAAGLALLHHDFMKLKSWSYDRLDAGHDVRVLTIQVLLDCLVAC